MPTARVQQPCPFIKVAVPAALVIAPMIAAAWIPETEVPLLVRQAALCIWGVGTTVGFEGWLFSKTLGTAVRSVGFVPARRSALATALLAGVPVLSVPASFMNTALLLHMGVVLVCLYLVFAARPFLAVGDEPEALTSHKPGPILV